MYATTPLPGTEEYQLPSFVFCRFNIFALIPAFGNIVFFCRINVFFFNQGFCRLGREGSFIDSNIDFFLFPGLIPECTFLGRYPLHVQSRLFRPRLLATSTQYVSPETRIEMSSDPITYFGCAHLCMPLELPSAGLGSNQSLFASPTQPPASTDL